MNGYKFFERISREKRMAGNQGLGNTHRYYLCFRCRNRKKKEQKGERNISL